MPVYEITYKDGFDTMKTYINIPLEEATNDIVLRIAGMGEGKVRKLAPGEVFANKEVATQLRMRRLMEINRAVRPQLTCRNCGKFV